MAAFAAPTLTIGRFESTFGNISDVGRLPNGDIAVSDRLGRVVTIFDTDGQFLRTLGREGEGPGEFLDPIAVAATDSPLLVWDWDQLRVTVFDLASDDIDTHRVEGLPNLTHHFGDVPAGFVVGNKGSPDM